MAVNKRDRGVSTNKRQPKKAMKQTPQLHLQQKRKIAVSPVDGIDASMVASQQQQASLTAQISKLRAVTQHVSLATASSTSKVNKLRKYAVVNGAAENVASIARSFTNFANGVSTVRSDNSSTSLLTNARNAVHRKQRRNINTAAKPNEITWTSDIYRTKCGLHVDRGLPQTFGKILIANRGEIACRVIRTCRELGIKTVAVFSDADANSMFVKMADEAYNIGPAASAQSYLRGDHIIKLAKQVGAQAIHPGYGFLSENAGFAETCFANGVEFIGPPVPAITAMGSKSASKNIMEAAGVRCVPGYHGENQDPGHLKVQAEKVGYPIMLKAVLGGGGKGMRIVWNESEFDEALEGCKRESLASFKDDRVLLERYIQNPRHIEFQVFADKQGNAVHLYERDCSVQRRHQKVFEEAPAPGMSEEQRAKMGKSATDAARAVGYCGAGTVEFIVDADTGEYFFMEMNTRLQVEHCVSEMIVHRDLVQWQLHVAAGHRLPCDQENVAAKGHALELRVYAENPRNNFFPTTGRLAYMKAPSLADDVRVETGVRSGDEVSVHYDPMISKLVVWGPNRDLCLKRMIRAIDDYKIAGLPTNLEFAKSVLNHHAFKQGEVTTKFIPTYKDELLPPIQSPPPKVIVSTVLDLLLKEKQHFLTQDARRATAGPWDTSSSFRVNQKTPVRRVTLDLDLGDGKKQLVQVDVSIPKFAVGNSKAQKYQMRIVGDATGTVHEVDGTIDEDGLLRAFVGEESAQAKVFVDAKTNEVHYFDINGDHFKLKLPTKAFGSSIAAGAGAVSPMAGKVVKVHVKSGDQVKAGQPLIVMEAMKMEHIIRAASDGVVKAIPYLTGDFCEGGKPVVIFQETEGQ